MSYERPKFYVCICVSRFYAHMLLHFHLPNYLSGVLEDNSAPIPKIHPMFLDSLFFGPCRSRPGC
jgi:hypothetical protein